VAQCQETADKVTAYTGADVEVICNTLLDPAAVSQAEKGADSKKIRGHLDIGDDELFLLHVGALIKVKNVYNLVKTSSDWKRKFKLALVGDGPERVRIEALVQRLNLENDILLLGEKSHDDTLAIIKSCDVLLLPSICEQMPNVVLEALALGRPVIATKVGGVPEIKSANLHLVNKVEEMTQATGNGIEAAEEDKIMKEYSLERVAGQYERLFLSLAGSKMR
jgi:glycosyltransferase involved in cell wall biosynthesis